MTPNAKVKVEYEYVKCKAPFLDSTASSSSQPTLICNTGTGQIGFDAKSKLFDGITDGSICYNDSWSYSDFRNSQINNEITSDYYLRPDFSNNNCQILTQPQSPSQSRAIIQNYSYFKTKLKTFCLKVGQLAQMWYRVLDMFYSGMEEVLKKYWLELF